MMYMPNRNLELFGEPPSLDEPSDVELHVLDRLEKLSQIEIPSYRQQACLDIDEALKHCDTKEDYDRIKHIASELAADQDLNVRVSLLDQLQFIGVRCMTNANCKEMLFHFITSCLIHSLRDQNHQVRKSAQTSLIILTNRGFYIKRDLEMLYVDTIQEMLMPDTNVSTPFIRRTHELNDFPPEAITLISALASFLGGEIIVKKFLDRYIELCSDLLLHVRKCCASSFPKICQVSGSKVVEQKLLPVFSQLCNDDIWGVRKACAEGFTSISNTVEQPVRVQVLTPLFLHLLNDTSRYVKLAAYQQLGPFITTFQNCEPDRGAGNKLKAGEDGRERSPTNPEYDNFLFWKSPVDMDTEALEKELYGEPKSPTSESASSSPPPLEPRTNSTPTATETATPTDTQTDTQTDTPTDAKSEEMVVDTENKAQAVEAVSTEDVKITSNLEERMSDKTNRDEFNAMFHGQDDEEEDDEDMDSMQIEEQGMQLRNYFQSLLEKGPDVEEDKENVQVEPTVESGRGAKEEEEVFDSNLSVSKSPDWGLATPDQLSEFHKDPLAPKIIKLSDCETGEEGKEKEGEEGGVLVGTIDITKPVFGVLENENENETAYSFSQKDEDLELASDSSDMDIETSDIPSVSSPVPGALIDCYTSMASNVDENNPRQDDDILTHCAYAFPGVVYTLGKDSWSLLRNTYLTLAENLPHSMSNVRQTLACSLHEIAHVIGPEQTEQDLIHPFNNFIYDIDSVKIGLLKNLSKFLQNVSPRYRQELLQQMKEIQKCEDRKNWRYRQTFASQLPHLSELYTTKEVYEHIQPIVLNLTVDQVSQVRQASFTALSKLIQKFKNQSETEYYETTCETIRTKFASSNKFTYRQSYVLICLELLQDEQYDVIDTSFVNELLELVTDRTPNVRLWVGQALLLLQKNTKNDQVEKSLLELQNDSDIDVRHYSTHVNSPVTPAVGT
ncbi:serine/threonine-protein phosphatase 4 regulatory subunit 1-like isoform X4 [Bolinopsis microptera]|uniref:serine/threonine-protein phosphatase 4 regulatory subunit 1-like isoform X4 n=1 Tax=Bolinopsis microptera TaxID=2820187 RepID=UPI003079C809